MKLLIGALFEFSIDKVVFYGNSEVYIYAPEDTLKSIENLLVETMITTDEPGRWRGHVSISNMGFLILIIETVDPEYIVITF